MSPPRPVRREGNEDIMSTEAAEIIREEVEGVARIGNGAKLHPCRVTKITHWPGKPFAQEHYRNIWFTCHCADTQNGFAAHRATLVRGAERNCRG